MDLWPNGDETWLSIWVRLAAYFAICLIYSTPQYCGAKPFIASTNTFSLSWFDFEVKSDPVDGLNSNSLFREDSLAAITYNVKGVVVHPSLSHKSIVNFRGRILLEVRIQLTLSLVTSGLSGGTSTP